MRLAHFIASAALTLPILALADDHQHSLEAHIHGVATLNVALEDQQLELQLASPAMNIVGFEYQPTSVTDKQRVAAAQSKLNNAAVLFTLSPAAQCSLTSVSIDNDLLEDSDKHEHEEEGHSHQETHDTGHQHRDITAHYHYRCETPAALNSIDLAGFFKQFAHTEKLQAQLITADHQQGVELSHKHTLISW